MKNGSTRANDNCCLWSVYYYYYYFFCCTLLNREKEISQTMHMLLSNLRNFEEGVEEREGAVMIKNLFIFEISKVVYFCIVKWQKHDGSCFLVKQSFEIVWGSKKVYVFALFNEKVCTLTKLKFWYRRTIDDNISENVSC